MGKRTPGQGGRMTTREYYYRCDVSHRGKGLRQTKISFGRVNNDNRGGDNMGHVENNLDDDTEGQRTTVKTECY